MRASDIKPTEIFSQEPGTGFPLLGDQRILISGLSAMSSFIQQLLILVGQDRLASILSRHGYNIGMMAALQISSQYKFDSPLEWLKSARYLGRIAGFGDLNIDVHSFDIEKEVLDFTVTCESSFEVECYHSFETKLPQGPICYMGTGAFSGFASVVFGKEVLVKEIACQAQKHKKCIFQGRSASEWGLSQRQIKELWASLDLNPFEKEISQLKVKLEKVKKELNTQKQKVIHLKSQEVSPVQDTSIIYRSQNIHQLIQLANKVAPTNSTVLIHGESGTGKEVIAKYIHKHSGRGHEPFRAVNCAALPSRLLESELFGHKKGAFTGADNDHKGLILESGKGTFFLDEIGDMPLELQSKLLRVLQEKEVRPVGGLRSLPVDARIIAATNCDLKSMVKEKTFREDLFYRLAVFPLTIDPLRQRKEDILLLSRHFLGKIQPDHKGFSPAAIRIMENYSWPGNVRELENCIEYAVILSGDDRISPEHLPQSMEGDPLTGISNDLPPLKDLEKRYVEMILKTTNGNKSKTAEILGISVTTLWRRLKEMQLK